MGHPPPPPPQPPYSNNTAQYQNMNGVGSLCPPPISAPTQNNVMSTQHQQAYYNQQQNQQYAGNAHYQYQQYQHQQYYSAQTSNYQQQGYYSQQQIPQQNYNQQQQYSYPQQYTNNAAAPQHHPPPQPRQQNGQHNNEHKHNSNDTNANVAASLRKSLPNNSHATAESAQKPPKKINPKMAKKYAGRGLKTIAISGPGMPTQRFKICVGNHPDDVMKWIEERKKRFPRMDGSHKKNNNVRGGKVAAGLKRGREEDNVKENKSQDKKAKSEAAATESNEEAEPSGLSSLLAGYGSSSSNEDEVGKQPKNEPVSSLKDDLANDTALVDGEGKAMSSAAVAEGTSSQPKRLCIHHQRGKCRHGDKCKFLHSHNPKDMASNHRQNKRQSQSERDKARNQYEHELKVLGLATPSSNGSSPLNNTSLLHKLLQRDKERERRLTLQLLRYIVDCDYLQGDTNHNQSQNKEVDEEVEGDDEDGAAAK